MLLNILWWYAVRWYLHGCCCILHLHCWCTGFRLSVCRNRCYRWIVRSWRDYNRWRTLGMNICWHIGFCTEKMKTWTKFITMKIIHNCFNTITNSIANNNVFDVIEKICDCIDVDKCLLMTINTSDELIGNYDELWEREEKRDF